MQTRHLLRSAMGIAVAAAFLSASMVFADTTSTANFSQGERVMVVATVNVRASANGTVIAQETRGATGTLVGGPTNANGYTWWQINYDNGKSGWTAEDFLQSPNVSLQSPSTSNVALTANASAAVSSSNTATNDLISSLRTQLNKLLAQIASLQAAQTAAAANSVQY